MFALFQRKRPLPEPSPQIAEAPARLLRPQSAAALLATPRRQRLLEHIWQRTALSRSQFATLYGAPLERYAALVQRLPASESHHHAYPGGMLDHGLEVVAYALKLRQSHLLPIGAPPEAQAAQAEAWTSGTTYAALLHDIGKIAVDLHVEHDDGSVWHPWHGPLRRPYRCRYRKDREYRLHGAATGLLYRQIIGADILDWLSGYADLWTTLLYALTGHYEHAGVLGELVAHADRASVAQELGGDPCRVVAAPKHALSRQLLEGLRHLVRSELRLNQPGPSDGWLTDDALWLVSKTTADRLRAHLLSQGASGIPEKNTTLFDVLQDYQLVQPTPDGKAIWRATVRSNSGWSHSFTFIRLTPALIWEAESRPALFAGAVRVEQNDGSSSADVTASSQSLESDAPPFETSVDLAPSSAPLVAGRSIDQTAAEIDESRTLAPTHSATPKASADLGSDDELDAGVAASIFAIPSSGLVAAKPCSPSGEHFIDWLRRGIAARKIIINDAKALVHTVADSAYLVSPGLFQRYAQEHPQVAQLAKQDGISDWRWAQKRFEAMKLHRKQANGFNIWTCAVSGPRKSRRLHGYLLADPRQIFVDVPPNNPYLKLTEAEPAPSASSG
jgi:integrating conjugative element relaxase (TIGR03760 family)